MNEYYSFGSQFLELYSTAKTFPSTWSTDGLSIEVYSKSGSSIAKNTYAITSSNAFACTKSGKTWVTIPNVTGLTNGEGMAVLKDSTGIIDTFAFFNGGNVSNLAVWISDTNNWYRTYNGGTSLGCTDLSNPLTAQSTLIRNGSSTSEDNFVRGSSSNKGLARYPDGIGNPWTDTDQTGAGSTFTTCTSNNANLIKTVDRATVPPGGTVQFSLTVANSSTSSLTNGSIIITDTLPSGMQFVSATSSLAGGTLVTPTAGATSGTITWTPATITASTQAVLTITMTVATNAAIATVYTNTASASGSAVTKPQSDSASVTVIAPTTPSFLVTSNRQAACTGSTVSTATPVITLTAKDQAGGTGNTLTNYSGTVTLNSSSSTSRWTKKTGGGSFTQIGSGGSYTFVTGDLGIAEFYLTNTAAQSVDLSVYDYVTFTPSDMTGLLSPVTYSSAGSCATLPLVSITSSSFLEGASGTNTARAFTVSLTDATTGAPFTATSAVTVKYSTVSGTAIAGTDFTAVSNSTITIPIGSSSNTVNATVTITGDANFEADETFQVVLSTPVNAQLGTSSATGTILNDDSPTIRAKYKMDESAWTTTGNAALDSINTNHASVNGTVAKGAASPAYTSATSTDATCGYGIFDAATSSYLGLPTSLQTLPNTGREGFTVTGWIKPNSGSGTQPIIGVSGDWNISLTGGTLSFSKAGTNPLTFISAVGGTYTINTISTATASLASGSWHFFALSLDKSTRTIVLYTYPATSGSSAYTNRVTANYSSSTDWVAPTSGTPAIGGTPAGSSNFKGQIDEINIYDDTLPQSIVEQVRVESRSCSCSLGSFRLTQPSTALSCPDTRAAISIEPMCADGITVKPDYAGTVSLTTTPTGGTYFSNATGGSSITSLAFSADLTKTAYLYYGNEASVCATASDGSITTTSSVCTSFHAYGFKVSAQPSDFVCGNTSSVTLTAYGKTLNSSGQACEVISGFSGNKNLKAWFTSTIDPVASAALASNSTLTVAGTGITTKTEPGSANLTAIPFANGTATLSLAYPNAAKILTLDFKHNDTPYTGSNCAATTAPFCALTAQSNAFVAYPGSFVVSDAGAGCTAGDATCSKFKKAGEDFTLTVNAVCSNGTTTATDFQSSAVILSVGSLVAPAGGKSGALTAATAIFSTADSGLKTITQSWSEVGVIKIKAAVASYFGKAIEGTSLNIGRFYPNHFETAVEAPMDCTGLTFTTACPGSNKNLAYSGQPLTKVTVTAYAFGGSSASGTGKTENYAGSFAKAVTISPVVSAGGAAISTTDPGGTIPASSPASSAVLSTSFINGVATLPYDDTTVANNDDEAIQFSFANRLTAPTNVYLRAAEPTGADGVTSSTVEGGFKVISGRIQAKNAAGSEMLALSVPVLAQFYNDSGLWATNTADSVSSWTSSPTGVTSLIGTNAAGSTTIAGSDPVSSGIGSLTADLPGSGSRGYVDISLNMPDYLKFTWSGGSASNPTARISFGLYNPAGNAKKIIYRREVR